MQIIDLLACDRQAHWLREIGKSDWGAAQFLVRHVSAGTLRQQTGEHTKLLLLTDGDALASFCTYADRDDIQPTDLTPWVGFVYTFPAYRGRRLMGQLFDEARRLAKADGFHRLYLSTGHIGLYEKYGFVFQGILTDLDGQPSRIYFLPTD